MSNQKRWANGAAETSVATQPATSQLFARAVSLHLDGRGDEALVERLKTNACQALHEGENPLHSVHFPFVKML